ncbi:hypothetical protein Bca4012_034389 [Brassica carinata]
MVFIQNGNDWTRRCTFLGKALNRIAKDLYNMTRANVAVFACSDQGREYHYSSPVAGDALALDLGGRSMDELAGLENQLMLAMESIQDAEANLG